MKKTLLIWFLALASLIADAQQFLFSHLSTSNGLSDNNAQALAIDRNGFLWIGTTDGLNEYDGSMINIYNVAGGSGLPSDTIRQLVCDRKNRLWVTHPVKVSFAGEDRKFHEVLLPSPSLVPTLILDIMPHGITLVTDDGLYSFQESSRTWKSIPWARSLLGESGFNTAVSVSDSRVAFVFESKVLVLDFIQKKIVFQKTMPHAVTACPVDDNRLAIADRNGRVSIDDMETGREYQSFRIDSASSASVSLRISEMRMAADGSLVLVSGRAGLIRIDPQSGVITKYTHQPLDPNSIASDILYRVLAGPTGEIITGTTNSGISICNINSRQAAYKRSFQDLSGRIFDGHANEMAEDDQGFLWIASFDRLIKWNRKTDATTFFTFQNGDRHADRRNLEIRTLCFDKFGRLWVGAIGAGVALFDRPTGRFHLVSDTSVGGALADTYINDIMEASDGKIWACTYKGVYYIDELTHRIYRLDKDPQLNPVAEKIVVSLYEDRQQRIWMGTQRSGVFCYDEKHKQLRHYGADDGLISNTGYAITGDNDDNIYVADKDGFSIIRSSGSIQAFTQQNGMRYHRTESILADQEGQIWIANNKCLVKFLPAENRFEYYEENAGISTDGFRYTAACRASDGFLFFATHRGIHYFDPRTLRNYTAQLRVHTFQLSLPDTQIRATGNLPVRTRYSRNNIQFHFAAINLNGSRHIAYQYRLDGFDKDWQTGTDLHTARYSSLPPGKYVFQVQASIDRQHWTWSDNRISLEIVPPFWKRWTFFALVALLAGGILFSLAQLRINRIRYKERLRALYNKRISETEMKALRAQMNPHFIFNSLNSINKYILKNDHSNASRYLTRFARLIRLILDNSNSKEVALSDELEALRLYLEMEALRFGNKFTYEILVDDRVSPDTLQVPPLIIQPYVENAIWHGLLHKESGGKLLVEVTRTSDNMLRCVIEDNGIGRERARELKSKSATRSKSLGMKLTEERIQVLNQYSSLNASIEIVDLSDSNQGASGTRVVLTIPI